MENYETLVTSVPAIIILAIGALMAFRVFRRRGFRLLRIGAAALIIGASFSAAYYWNLWVTPNLLNIELTDRQVELLSQLDLPDELSELSASQKKAVQRIDEMLTYLEDKYDMDFRYLGYAAEDSWGGEKLTAFPADGNPLTEIVTVKRDGLGVLTDDCAWARAKALYEKEAKPVFESSLKKNCSLIVTHNGTANIADVKNISLKKMHRVFQAESVIFVHGEYTKSQLKTAAEAVAKWASKNGLILKVEIVQLDGKEIFSTITTRNYQKFLQGESVGIRVVCNVWSDGTYTIK